MPGFCQRAIKTYENGRIKRLAREGERSPRPNIRIHRRFAETADKKQHFEGKKNQQIRANRKKYDCCHRK